jgi:D-alanyl-D-alanine carboxypeptidase
MQPACIQRTLTVIGFLCVAISLSHLPAGAGSETGSEEAIFPDTAAGRIVEAWFEAFNTGDYGVMSAFEAAHWSERLLARGTDDSRRQMFEGIFNNLGVLRPDRTLRATPDELSVLAETHGGDWVEVGFRFDPDSQKMMGLLVNLAGPPEDLPPAGVHTEAEALAGIAESLKKLADEDRFAGTVLIAEHDAPIFSEAYGPASREFGVPNNMDTKFNLGSINKMFTKVAVAQLLEQGRVSLDDTLGKFLPDYSNRQAASKITVRHLVRMTSGIGDFFGEAFEATPKAKLRGNADYLPLFAAEPLAFEPGTQQMYSNGGYTVLGLVVEKAAGQDYYDYVREHIFLPAGMMSTDSYEADAIIENLAWGYTRQGADQVGGSLRSNMYTRPARGSAAGGGYSTVGDMLKFVLALTSNELVSPAYTEWIFGGPEPQEGIVPERESVPNIALAGGAPGINSALEIGIAGKYTVIVLSNLDPPAATSTASMIRQWLAAIE